MDKEEGKNVGMQFLFLHIFVSFHLPIFLFHLRKIAVLYRLLLPSQLRFMCLGLLSLSKPGPII